MKPLQAQPKFHNAPHFKDFWEKGNGKELLDRSGWKPSLQNFSHFSHLFHQVDETGDEAVANTYMKLPYSEANALIQKFSSKPVSENDELPQALKKLFLEMQEVPDWFDPELANTGARFCMKSGTNALIILRDFSLMGGYDFAYLNKPLIVTGALKKGAVKRLKDTLEFWVNVTREDALKVHSDAYKLIVRTRMMHSYARLTIRKKAEHWDYENWGEPINHWDMIATYLGFSLVFMQGLRKLGVSVSPSEEKGVFHLWKYVGYLLGIPVEYLPDNDLEATENFYLWTAVQDKGDVDSALLAKSLLDENMENTIYRFQFQRKLLTSLHKSMNWYLLDKEVLERLQIDKPTASGLFPGMIKGINKAAEKVFDASDAGKLRKHIDVGNKQQLKVLKDYIEHTPKDFHY